MACQGRKEKQGFEEKGRGFKKKEGIFFSWLEETLKAIGGKTQVSFLQAVDSLVFRVLYDVLWVL